MKRKATITVETERLLIIRRSPHTVDHWCHACQAEVKMIRIDEAAAIAGISQRTVFHLAEAGEIHFMETVGGQTLFCLRSLSKQRSLDDY
jgi:hypothetical protein